MFGRGKQNKLEPTYSGEMEEPLMNDSEAELMRRADELERRARTETAMGIADFFGVVAGVAVILLMLLILITLINWLWKDAGEAIMMLINLI